MRRTNALGAALARRWAYDVHVRAGVRPREGAGPGDVNRAGPSYDESTNTAYLGLMPNVNLSLDDQAAAFIQAMAYVMIAHDEKFKGRNSESMQGSLLPSGYSSPEDYRDARLWQDVLAREESFEHYRELGQAPLPSTPRELYTRTFNESMTKHAKATQAEEAARNALFEHLKKEVVLQETLFQQGQLIIKEKSRSDFYQEYWQQQPRVSTGEVVEETTEVVDIRR